MERVVEPSNPFTGCLEEQIGRVNSGSCEHSNIHLNLRPFHATLPFSSNSHARCNYNRHAFMSIWPSNSVPFTMIFDPVSLLGAVCRRFPFWFVYLVVIKPRIWYAN